MEFLAAFERTCRWVPQEGEGLEHLRVRADAEGVTATGVVIGARGGRPYGIRYRITCSADWRVRAFAVGDCEGGRLAMTSDGEGRWRDEAGAPMPAFDGAIDIDLSGSPFTNTLPIRRLAAHAPGHAERFEMVYIPFATLVPEIDEQRYTCVTPFSVYLYEAVDRSFEARLPVDDAAIVTDYPTLFRRRAV